MMLNFKILAYTRKDIKFLVETIRKSFRNVAQRFGLTQENAPLHPSNCTYNWIKADMNRGVTYFIMKNENQIAGCVACEMQVQMYVILRDLPCFMIRDNGALAKHKLIMFYQKLDSSEQIA